MSTPPLIVPIEEIFRETKAEQIDRELIRRLRDYRRHSAARPTSPVRPIRVRADGTESRRGGSVGTGAWIILLRGPGGRCSRRPRRRNRRSSPDTWTARRSRNQGERVVTGQRLMQAAGDIFLGWQQGPDTDGVVRDFYVRQLREAKDPPSSKP